MEEIDYYPENKTLLEQHTFLQLVGETNDWDINLYKIKCIINLLLISLAGHLNKVEKFFRLRLFVIMKLKAITKLFSYGKIGNQLVGK